MLVLAQLMFIYVVLLLVWSKIRQYDTWMWLRNTINSSPHTSKTSVAYCNAAAYDSQWQSPYALFYLWEREGSAAL